MTDILTLQMDQASQAHFEEMRQRYFPPELNLIPAHLTLFHTLPATPNVSQVLGAAAAGVDRFDLKVTGLRSLGRGVAYTLLSPELLALHRSLAGMFTADLSRQDQQKFQPHVVIQNKSTSAAAKELLVGLQAGFRAFQVRAEGLDLWHYRNGPWEHVKSFAFRS